MKRILLGCAIICGPCFLAGCLAAAAIEVAAETVEAGVEITGAAAGAVVDVVIPDGDDDEDDKKD